LSENLSTGSHHLSFFRRRTPHPVVWFDPGHNDWAQFGRSWSIPFVDSHHHVTDQFAVLTDALEDPGTDLRTVLAVLVDDLRAAIPSVLGVTVTITEAGDAVTLTSAEPDLMALAGASLRIPLDEVFMAGRAAP